MTDFCALAANGSLQVSGGLSPGITDKQLLLYSAARNQALPIQADGKMGYTAAANIAITEPTQFPTKAYVDAADNTKLNLSGGTMIGHINIVGTPELSTHAVSRAYVDQVENSLVKKSGSTMTGSLILHADPTSDLQASTKKYVDDRVALTNTTSDTTYLSKTSIVSQTLAGPLVMAANQTIS